MNSSNSWSPAITHEDILAETQRNQLIEELRSAIRDIIGGILFKPDIVIEDSPLSVALCLIIERILLYRLQVPLTELLPHLINSSTSRPNNNLSIRYEPILNFRDPKQNFDCLPWHYLNSNSCNPLPVCMFNSMLSELVNRTNR